MAGRPAARTARARAQQDHARCSSQTFGGGSGSHAVIARAVPNRPCGRNTSTSATSSVAMIFASVGEKNTEMMPSREADQQRGDDGAAQRAEPADDDDDEGEQQRVAAHQVVRLADRHDQHGGDRRQRGAEREDAGIDPVDCRCRRRCAISRSHWVARMTRPIRVRVSSSQIAARSSDRGGDDRELVAGIAEPGQLDAAARTAPRPAGRRGRRSVSAPCCRM